MKDDFFDELDLASKAKQLFTAYYFKLYLNIISSAIIKFNLNKRLVYLDFFAGAGKDREGNELTPLKVIDAISSNPAIADKCFLYFNDLENATLLKQNVDAKMKQIGKNIQYKVDSINSKSIDVSTMFKKDDIVLSFVDSFGYVMSDVSTISKLISNNFSDSIVFINLDYFRRFITVQKERPSYIKFFGGEDNLERFIDMFTNCENKDYVCEELVMDYVRRLTLHIGQKMYCLPIFFRISNENTSYSHVIIVISKSFTGIKQIRESFVEVDENVDSKGKRNENFYFFEGKIVVCENKKRGEITVFGDENKKYYNILGYLPKNKNDAITSMQLLEIIDKQYMELNYYCSGYSMAFLRRALSFLESEKKIEIVYFGKRKRVEYTYGENTRVYARREDENN